MRKVSTLVGLTLFALASSARAEETAAEADTAAPPTAEVATSAPAPTAAPPADQVDAALASEPATPRRKLQVGLAFLPMALGKYNYRPDSVSPVVKSDAAFAYGAALSVGYEVLPHLVVGLAPQAIFNVQEKTPQIWAEAVSEYDLMARVAYMFPLVETIDVYAEFLPGYSLIKNSAASAGLVLAFGAGFAMELTDRVFVNIAGGYQFGFQKWANGATSLESQTRYLRVALGAGVKL
ncbi:MAG TPA: hypothetical protein VF524_05200 [Polyangia bacterium]